MHDVLARQLRQLGLGKDDLPSDISAWQLFLDSIEGSYEDADRSQQQLEQSLSTNQELAELSAAQIARKEAHYKDLFRHSPIPTWEEDFTAAHRKLEDLRSGGVRDIEAFLWENPRVLIDLVTSIVVTDVNPAVARLIGTEDPGTSKGQIEDSLLTKDNTDAWIAQLTALWQGEDSLRIDHLVGERVTGEVFHGILEWHPPRVGDEYDYSRVVVSIVDITDRIVAEQRMQEALESKDEFLASISHELRTPLTSVLGFAEILRSMDQPNEDEAESMLEIIASQASDLSNIVEDLLVAARAELGQLSVVTVPIDVHAQIAQVVEGRGDGADNITLPSRPPEPVRAIGDPARVRQILRNLLTNAGRYGGDQVTVDVVQRDSHVAVRVCDTGSGLAPEQRELVFERYYRTPVKDGKPGSVGIGLTISRDLARMMGGELGYSYENGLSVFELTLKKTAR